MLKAFSSESLVFPSSVRKAIKQYTKARESSSWIEKTAQRGAT